MCGLFMYSDIWRFFFRASVSGMSEDALKLAAERGKSDAAVRGAGQWRIDMAVCWPQQILSRYRNLSDTCQVNRAACRCQPGPSSLLPPSRTYLEPHIPADLMLLLPLLPSCRSLVSPEHDRSSSKSVNGKAESSLFLPLSVLNI